MQVLKFFLASLLLFCSSPSLSAKGHYEPDNDLAYEQARVIMHLLKWEKRSPKRLRRLMSKILILGGTRYRGESFEMTGEFGEEVLIRSRKWQIQIPAWCLLRYVQELENAQAFKRHCQERKPRPNILASPLSYFKN